MGNMATKTDTKAKPLATAAEKTAPTLKGYTKTTPEKMLKIHNEDTNQFKWVNLAKLKEDYSLAVTTFYMLAERYHIPFITTKDNRPALFSVPCLEWVLALPELHGTVDGDTVDRRLEAARAEAIAEAKREAAQAYKDKLEAISA